MPKKGEKMSDAQRSKLRKRSWERRSENVYVRLTEDEVAKLDKARGVQSRSAYVQGLVRGARPPRAIDRGLAMALDTHVRQFTEHTRDVLRETQKQGTNLNQIARAMNILALDDGGMTEAQMDECIAAIEQATAVNARLSASLTKIAKKFRIDVSEVGL